MDFRKLFEGVYLDSIVSFFLLTLVFGLSLDFAIHIEGITWEEEGWITFEHMIMYVSFFIILLVIITSLLLNYDHSSGFNFPDYYRYSFFGASLFILSMFFDIWWHSNFGYETTVLESVTSTPHILLYAGAFIIGSCPIRSSFNRDNDGELNKFISVIISSLFISAIGYKLLYINPFIAQIGFNGGAEQIEVIALICFPVLFVSASLILFRRFDLETGSILILFLLPFFIFFFTSNTFYKIVPVLCSGFIGEFIYYYMKKTKKIWMIRLYGFLVPSSMVASYLLVVQVILGLDWVIHIWSGTIVMSGAAGLFLTYTVIPYNKDSIENKLSNYE